ncbi:MAG: nucleotide pyrophosphohydrolase [bacterium]|nr:nucleotide pyrophosphohydrolase [bacterium]
MTSSDDQTTVNDLREMVRAFVDQRDWGQFHSPKNLTMALAIEVAELMEHFQWITPEASRAVADDPAKLAEVREEMADVMCYVLAIANELNVDMASAMRDKMKKNVLKYPAEEYRGRYGPEDVGG